MRGSMTQTKAQPDWRRPLETSLDLSAMPVPLRWAEGGQVVRLNNSRISLEDIITYYRMGYTAEMIGDTYPWIELADIYLVIAFYLRNKKVIHAHLRESYEQADEEWAEMLAQGITSESSYRAYCESRGYDWFNGDE